MIEISTSGLLQINMSFRWKINCRAIPSVGLQRAKGVKKITLLYIPGKQVNWFRPHVRFVASCSGNTEVGSESIPQPTSSELSPQSLMLSHRHQYGRQLPLSHLNIQSRQVPLGNSIGFAVVVGGRIFDPGPGWSAQSFSSDNASSPQSFSPSHTWLRNENYIAFYLKHFQIILH